MRGIGAVPMIYFNDLVLDRTMDIVQWLDVAQSLDLDATELHDRSLPRWDQPYLESLAGEISKRGLAVSQLVGAADFTHPDPEVRRKELEDTTRNISAAQTLGATCVRITAGQIHPENSYERGMALAVEGIQRALDYADGKGVQLAYENHYKDYFWQEPDFSQKAEVFLDVLNRLSDTPLKVNFDCSNQVMIGEDPVALLDQVLPYVVHVHCSDRIAPNEYRHAITGEGIVNYPAIFSKLAASGYAGWLSIEYNGTEGLEGLTRSIQNVRWLWAEACE